SIVDRDLIEGRAERIKRAEIQRRLKGTLGLDGLIKPLDDVQSSLLSSRVVVPGRVERLAFERQRLPDRVLAIPLVTRGHRSAVLSVAASRRLERGTSCWLPGT